MMVRMTTPRGSQETTEPGGTFGGIAESEELSREAGDLSRNKGIVFHIREGAASEVRSEKKGVKRGGERGRERDRGQERLRGSMGG
jgi:hypothetical protein